MRFFAGSLALSVESSPLYKAAAPFPHLVSDCCTKLLLLSDMYKLKLLFVCYFFFS